MRIGLLTEGGYPYVNGDAWLWCDRLVRGLAQHEFEVYALSRSRYQEEGGLVPLPPQVRRLRTAPLWTAEDASGRFGSGRSGSGRPGFGPAVSARSDRFDCFDRYDRFGRPGCAAVGGAGPVRRWMPGRRARRRFAECYGELAASLCTGGSAETAPDGRTDRFAGALYGLAELARDEGGLMGALRSETAVHTLERACRAPGGLRAAHTARVPDLLAVAAHLEHALRPLSLDWYEDDGLGSVDLCHAASGGAALPGLLARHFSDVPLLVTEYGVHLRTRYLADTGSAPAVRALLAAFHGRLAAETYHRAALVTPGNAHVRRWQERCGADRAKLRTVHPGMDAAPFAEASESPERAVPDTLVWVGRVEPAKDLISLLHAFAEIRRTVPRTRLRIIGSPSDAHDEAYLAHCRTLAAQLFPDEADGPQAVGDNPVSFAGIGDPEVPTVADAYASGTVVVLPSVAEGFPVGLVEAMFCGRATVSTDVGAVVEVIGGTGLVVPPRNPRALAEACVALLRDPERRERLGAAARARALELFTVEQNVEAFQGIYLEIVARCPIHRVVLDETGAPLPFAVPAEAHIPVRWTRSATRPVVDDGTPRAAEPPVRATAPGWAVGGAR